jgi:hypothetical protein
VLLCKYSIGSFDFHAAGYHPLAIDGRHPVNGELEKISLFAHQNTVVKVMRPLKLSGCTPTYTSIQLPASALPAYHRPKYSPGTSLAPLPWCL